MSELLVGRTPLECSALNSASLPSTPQQQLVASTITRIGTLFVLRLEGNDQYNVWVFGWCCPSCISSLDSLKLANVCVCVCVCVYLLNCT